jgi:ADP-ribose pyrophosphatase YjhB (NUDIX family)
VTFTEGIPDGRPARQFYARLGFLPGEPGPINAAGFATQVYRRVFVHAPTVRVVLQDGARYLLVQHETATSTGDGLWALPGGRVNPDDPDYEATLRREMREEFQIDVDVLRLIGTYTLRERQHHVFHARPLSTDLMPEPSEIAAVGWFTLDEVRECQAAGKLFAPFMLDAILASRDHASEP